MDALAIKAFTIGVASALSLLLGAVASFFWRPGDRVIAFLMALGGGTLLAALTLDLVGEAVERGHFVSLSFGLLCGGMLFISCDKVVGDYGGFMRKAATTMYHVRRQKHNQYRCILVGIERTDIFKHLETRDFKALSHSIQSREVREYLNRTMHFDRDKTERFVQSVLKAMQSGERLPTARDLDPKLVAHGGAAIAIWLGIMLDGIPQSMVIGASLVHAQVSLSLMVGLLISNFPEALSSSIGMRQQGLSVTRIVIMWSSIVLITGIGAAVGNIFFSEAEPFMFALVEGIAAGAMLTMIAQTMMPEAYFKGGSIVGFATLLGFIAAIISKTLQ
jgi:zinc transporter ZupT